MNAHSHQVVSLDELERYPAMTGAPVLMPLRRRLAVEAFGINCWTAPAGKPVIERHSEPDGDDEVYLAAFTGDTDAAFEQLARALALGPPRVRKLAAESEDFVSLHADPRWRQVVAP
ncbi:MAG: TPR end-of-group domain-containing protein [Gaiellaceae bacterium]